MTGREIPFGGGVSKIAIIAAIVAIACVFVGFMVREPGFVVLALWPAILVVTFSFSRQSPAFVAITGDRLVFPKAELEIPFSSITGLRIHGETPMRERRPPNGELEIYYENGGVSIKNCPEAAELYEFLFKKAPDCGSRTPPDPLEIYYRNAIKVFGDDHVCSYRGRDAVFVRSSQSQPFVGGTMLAAAGWILAGAVMEDMEPWLVAGIIVITLSLAVYLAVMLARKSMPSHVKNRPMFGLVVSPQGFALAQNKVVGKLRWSDVRGIRAIRQRSSETTPALNIAVAGASIVIFDVFDRPLGRIHEQMDEYLKAEA